MEGIQDGEVGSCNVVILLQDNVLSNSAVWLQATGYIVPVAIIANFAKLCLVVVMTSWDNYAANLGSAAVYFTCFEFFSHVSTCMGLGHPGVYQLPMCA